VNRLRRLSVKLGLVLFLVVAGALAIVYLAVLPQLESRLVGAKIRELERAAPTLVGPVVRAEQFERTDVASFYATSLNARVVVYDRLTRTTLAPVADSSGLSSEDVQQDAVALRAARTDLPASGRVERGGSEYAEAAVPAGQDSVVLLSASLSDALTTVSLVRRSLLIAAGVSLLVSWLAGYLAAWGFSRRIRRLEGAAERIAGGDFDEPVADAGRDEVGQLAHAFDRMRLRLAQLDHARREFIANASHELRTPLFSLGGFLELITDEDLDDRTRRDFLAEMQDQVARLTRLATDLLDLSRLDAGQLAVERVEVDLGAAARTVADEFRVLAEAEAHELIVLPDGPAPAWGDEQRVLQIARVLVENALRHTPAGTTVRVTAGTDAERAWLEVADDGPGVSPAEREHVFDRFYRGDGGKASGSGLGLAIASELAGRMDGGIKLRSDERGTTFRLSLPAAPFSRDRVSEELLGVAKTPAV